MCFVGSMHVRTCFYEKLAAWDSMRDRDIHRRTDGQTLDECGSGETAEQTDRWGDRQTHRSVDTLIKR
jgi:hypothetical protein